MNTQTGDARHFQPRPEKGHLYYIRLDTSFGKLYKLGFTTLGSVQERLSYQGKGHEEFIDKVFCFAYMEEAFDVETTLHNHFSNKATFKIQDPDMPLYGNGQSELYSEDILGMDPSYTEMQFKRTELNIRIAMMRRSGETEEQIREHIKTAEDVQNVLLLIGPPLKWLMRVYDKLLALNASKNERARQARVKSLIERARDARRCQVGQDLFRNTHSRLEAGVQLALANLKRKDLQAFEDIVDVNAFAYNLAEAMTEDLVLTSDYMIIAHNWGLIDLMNAMDEGHPRDLLMKPVEDTYKAVLRHYVKNHRLLTEDLILPDGPLYRVSEDHPDYDLPALPLYAPRKFLDLFGRDWTLPNTPELTGVVGWLDLFLADPNTLNLPIFTRGQEWIEFPVAVRNRTTGFEGELIIRATFTSRGKLALSFPNFLSLDEAACKQRDAYEDSIAPESKIRPDFPHRNSRKPPAELKAWARQITGFPDRLGVD